MNTEKRTITHATMSPKYLPLANFLTGTAGIAMQVYNSIQINGKLERLRRRQGEQSRIDPNCHPATQFYLDPMIYGHSARSQGNQS